MLPRTAPHSAPTRSPGLGRRTALVCLLAGLTVAAGAALAQAPQQDYAALVDLWKEFRKLEQGPRLDGAPDYTRSAMEAKARGLRGLRGRLEAFDTAGWPIEHEVDFELVRAEMNGLDFYLRVLRPWARDPAFYNSVWTYKSDTPAHEGPTHHALVELWQYEFPLSTAAQEKLATELATIPPLLQQARGNLTGNARELWEAGIGDLRSQAATLDGLRGRISGTSGALRSAVDEALEATNSFVTWLEEQAPSKTAPSGIGKENYTWWLRNVHLVPMSWEEEVELLQRELARAHSSLALEEHKNRQLEPLVAAATAEEYDERAQKAVTEYIDFLEREKILHIEEWMDEALRAQVGSFVPEEERNFFRIAMHYDPTTLYTHFYHWWDLARMEHEPHASPIRRVPSLYNIFDSRAEGLSTAFEEIAMHLGLYEDRPRVREIVWIMLAQRAARGLGSLWVHSGDMTMKEARDFHVDWTPRGWMSEELDLLGFEQLLYLRQPGYGSTYITGKYLFDELLAARKRQVGDEAFDLREFFADVDAAGVIPVSLIQWELTGDPSAVPTLHP